MAKRGRRTARLPSDADARIMHELHVYKDELTTQNEELIRSRAALEQARDRLADLYDFAPNGYLTLDRNGVILQINLTGAAMLGGNRTSIEGLPLLGFVRSEHRALLLEFLRGLRSSDEGKDAAVDLGMVAAGSPRELHLICKPRRGGTQSTEYVVSMIDVTERRRLETERDAAAREQAALASRLISIQDEERQRIARDLHDNVGQQVTALRLLLDALTTSNGADLRQRVARAQSIVEQLDRQLDFLTTELRPNVLDLGAVSAIGQFVDEWSSTLGIAVDFRFEGAEDLRLKPEVETHLYRIVQEALNNIAKHAEARRVEVRVTRYETAIVLTIVDDGRGFNPALLGQSPNRRGGLGLVSMRERARIINATFDIRSAPGEGATMTLCVPTAGTIGRL